MFSPKIDDLDKPIFGAQAFLEWLPGRNVKQIYYGLEFGLIDADKYGKKWVSTPRRLLNQFSGRRTFGEIAQPAACEPREVL